MSCLLTRVTGKWLNNWLSIKKIISGDNVISQSIKKQLFEYAV